MFTWALLDALKHGDTSGDGIIELSELAAYVQDLVPSLNIETCRERGVRGVVPMLLPERFAAYRQSARFGSRGENFVIARQLP
jgi:hypothetical protein